MRRTTFALFASAVLPLVGSAAGLVAACTDGTLDYVEGDASSDALVGPASDAGTDAPPPVDYDCPDASPPATSIECTGLYANLATKQIAASAQAYAPATPLWSDGATKLRWIELPPGTKIDVTDPNEWTFPIGTKVFKEFRVGGKRVETRLFQKVLANYWVHATYAWNADDTAAPISYGATVPAGDAGNWVIPTPDQCDQCHKGRSDRVLGFEQVSLGLPGATGLTLAQLAAQDLLTPAVTSTSLTLGDDGTGLAAPALGWLHVNCGVTCHNDNPGSTGYGAGMLLRLDPSLLDGRTVTSAFDPIRTTENVLAISGGENGIPRILPGDPSASAIVELISERGVAQMPPIASRLVDTANVAAIESWIQHMPAAAAPDSGAPDAGHDSGTDSGTDAGSPADASEDAPSDATVASDASDASDAGKVNDDGGPADTGASDAESDASPADTGADAGD